MIFIKIRMHPQKCDWRGQWLEWIHVWGDSIWVCSTCALVYTGSWAHMHTEARQWCWIYCSISDGFIHLGQHLSLNLELGDWLSNPTNHHVSALRRTRIIDSPGFLYGCWGPKLRSSVFQKKHTYWLRHISRPRSVIYSINLLCAKVMWSGIFSSKIYS